MKKLSLLLLIFMVSLLHPVSSYAQTNLNIKGSWLGKLAVSGIELRIVFNIKKADDNTYKATMDSPDQGAKDIPVSKVTLTGNKIKIEMPQIRGEYNGTVNGNSKNITGTWTQAGKEFNLPLEKQSSPVVFKRPQEPKPPFPYNSEDLTFENKKAGVTLAGTFTSPKEGGPFPVVVLITGSGAQNRDEELMGHKPFLVLSDYLTRHGIAVLRYDDRGFGKSTGNFASANSADFAGDALAAVEYLKTRKDVNPDKIGLIGHSEGGLIAPMVAVESNDVAFIVLMAGPGLPGDQILLKQSALIEKVNGEPEEDIENSTEIREKIYHVIKTENDSTIAFKKIKEILGNAFDGMTEKQKKEVKSKEAMYQNIPSILSPWFRYFITYDPAPLLEKVKCPVLAIDGSKDLQVPPKEDLEAIKKALTEGGNKNFKTDLLPGLNHLFQTAKTGSPKEYSQIEETIAPVALKTISDWILEIVK